MSASDGPRPIPAGSDPSAGSGATRGRRHLESGIAFGLAGVLYLVLGAYLVFASSAIALDAWSRVGNAYYVLFSRDPHLAAIGFVWNPLPSMAMMVLLPLQVLWPPLATVGFSANIVSALFMAGSVAVLLGLLSDIGVGRAWRWVLVALFALHPMILLYGANGLSEAPFLFFVLAAARALLRWERRNLGADLVIAGLALGLAYMTRYEAIAVAGAAILGVGLLTLARGHGARNQRLLTATADSLLVGFPFAVSFIGWSAASWIIVGSPFATFSSVYGNTSQVTLAGAGITDVIGATASSRLAYFGRELFGLAPGLVPIVALAVSAVVSRRTLRPLVPLAVFGSALVFSGLTLASGSSFGWLRFAVMAIPLATVLAGLLIVQPGGVLPRRAQAALARFPAWTERAVLLAAVVALLAVAVPISRDTMANPLIGREESPPLVALGTPRLGPSLDAGRLASVTGETAAYVDSLHLARGSVLVDVATGFGIVLQSSRPDQFVITPDRDFQQTLRDPGAFGVRYILVPRAAGYGNVDAILRNYPGIYDTGAGLGTLVRSFGIETDQYAWRLYEIK